MKQSARVGGWGLALMILAASAEAQQSLPEKLSRETRDSMMLVINQAAAAGLPTDALYAKAAEGVLKRADDARILLAMRNLSRSLAAARASLPGAAAPGTIVAAASALQAGVEPGIIARYAAVSKGSEADLALAYVTLADLIASTVPAAAASRSVELLLRNGVREAELASFRAAVVRDIQSGAKPEDALKARVPVTRRP
jgi:hypothetical protein